MLLYKSKATRTLCCLILLSVNTSKASDDWDIVSKRPADSNSSYSRSMSPVVSSASLTHTSRVSPTTPRTPNSVVDRSPSRASAYQPQDLRSDRQPPALALSQAALLSNSSGQQWGTQTNSIGSCPLSCKAK